MPATPSPWIRRAVLGPSEALGMLALGYLCAWLSVGMFEQVGGDPSAAWRWIPGWAAWAWMAKRAAVSWWRVEGAAWAGAVLVLACSAAALAGGWGLALGWAAAGAVVCMWPVARAKAVHEVGGGP